MNNKYTIRVKHPLLRPGITIKTEVSEKYVVPVVKKLMELVRERSTNTRNQPMSENLITTEDWMAELDRVAAEKPPRNREWSDMEEKMIRRGFKKMSRTALTAFINQYNTQQTPPLSIRTKEAVSQKVQRMGLTCD